MFDSLRSIKDTVEDTTATIRWFLGVVIILAALGVAFGKWLSTLNLIQLVSFYVGIAVLILIGITFLLDWNRKRNIYRIPDLLALIDQMSLDLIEDYKLPNETEDITDDLAKVIGFNDIGQLKNAVKEKNKKRVEAELAVLANRYQNLVSNKKPQETSQNLLLISGFLNSHNVGLERALDSVKYHRLYRRIKELQRRVPSANINAKINEYWRWSEGLYCVILSEKPFTSISGLNNLMPPKYLASSAIMRPQIQDFTTILISAVRESIETYKEGNNASDKDKTNKKKN